MNGQPLLFALHAMLALLLGIAIYTDLRSRIIPNWLNIAVAVIAPIMWVASEKAFWPDMAIQLGLGLAVFALFTVFFALGAMGGGDVKLLGALALWLSLTPLINMLLIMSILGGILTIGMYVRHKATKSDAILEIPYGVAISLAGFWAIYERYLNHFG